MDSDDLPPTSNRSSDDSTFGGALGQVFGWAVMMAGLFAVVGLIAYALLHWLR